MSTNPVPPNAQSVTPALVQRDCAAAIDWYHDVFGAQEIPPRMTGPDGTVAHAEIRILGTTIMMGEEQPDGPTRSPLGLGGTPTALFLYAEDAKDMWQRALDAGAEVIFPYELQFYGDEGGRIRDPFGHQWVIGRHVEDVSQEEMERRMAAFFEEDQS